MDHVKEVTIKSNAKVYHVDNGYYYYLRKRQHYRAFLVCSVKKSCPGRASMPSDPELRFASSLVLNRPHNHDPKHNWLQVQLIRKRIMERSASEGTPFRKIYNEETKGLDPEMAGELPFETLQSSMFRARRQELGPPGIHASLQENGQALENNERLGSTKRGEKFCRVDNELASQLDYSSMTSSMKRARKAGSHTEVGNKRAKLVESDPCASTNNILNVTDPCPSTSNLRHLEDPCASMSHLQHSGDSCDSTDNIQNLGDPLASLSNIKVEDKIPPSITTVTGTNNISTTVSTASASVKVKPSNTLQSTDTSAEEKESNQKDGVGTTHIDISVKTLESAIQRLESVSNKLTAATLLDSYDQFGKYISSVLRGLPMRKVNYLKQKIMSDVTDTIQEVVGIATMPTPHPTQLAHPPVPAANSGVRFDKEQSMANLPKDPHTFVSGGKMPLLYFSALAPNQPDTLPHIGVPQASIVAATMGSNSLNVPSSCSSDKSTTIKAVDCSFSPAIAHKSTLTETPSPQSSDPLSPRSSSTRGRKRRKTSAAQLNSQAFSSCQVTPANTTASGDESSRDGDPPDSHLGSRETLRSSECTRVSESAPLDTANQLLRNSEQDFEIDIEEGIELAQIKPDQSLFETVLCGESSNLYIKEEVPEPEEPPEASVAASPLPATEPLPPATAPSPLATAFPPSAAPITCHLCSVHCGSIEDLTTHLTTKHPDQCLTSSFPSQLPRFLIFR